MSTNNDGFRVFYFASTSEKEGSLFCCILDLYQENEFNYCFKKYFTNFSMLKGGGARVALKWELISDRYYKFIITTDLLKFQ